MVRRGNPAQREWVGNNRTAIQRDVYASSDVCCHCGKQVDFDADPRSRWAPSVEHFTPRSKGGDPFDRANCGLAHYGCNSARGNRELKLYRDERPEYLVKPW